jgi:hypothetical protein
MRPGVRFFEFSPVSLHANTLESLQAPAIRSPRQGTIVMPDFITKLVAMLKAIFAAIFGGLREGAAEIAGDVRRAAGFTRRAAEATTRLVGRGLTGPAIVLERTAGAVGGLLGALVPRPAPTAAQVANDNPAPAAAPRRSYVPAQMSAGDRIQGYARAMQKGDTDRAMRLAGALSTSEVHWLAGLDSVALGHLVWMSPNRIEEHVGAQNEIDRSPLLPPVEFVPDAPATVARNLAHRRLAREAIAECEAPLPGMGFGR